VVFGAAADHTLPKWYKKKKRTGSLTKKSFHIFFDESQKVFPGWKEMQGPWDFSSCHAFIDWCHFFGDSHIPAICYIELPTKPICIIEIVMFPKNVVWRCANTSSTSQI
jgi:hypothetical protein